MSDYNRFRAHWDDNLKALEELASLKAQKNAYLSQYQTMKSTQLTSRIGSIHEEIAKLWAKLGTLEHDLTIVNAQIKAENAQRL